MPWSNSVSQDRLWKIRIISCLWVAPLNKKAAAFVQLSWDFACRHHFLTYGREMQILHLPHMGSQSDLTSILDLNPIYLGVEKKIIFKKTQLNVRQQHHKIYGNVYVDYGEKESIFLWDLMCREKSYSVYLQKEKWDRRMVSLLHTSGKFKRTKRCSASCKNKEICFPGY